MIVLIILFSCFLGFTAISFLSGGKVLNSIKVRARYALSIMLISTGISHFTNSEQLIQMVPSFVPFPEVINVISGIMEFLFALGLLTKYHKITGKALALFFIFIFPANINNAIYGNEVPGGIDNIPYYLWIRLLFQPVYIWWAIWCTHQYSGRKR